MALCPVTIKGREATASTYSIRARSRRRSGLVLKDSAALHHERHVAQRGSIGKVVAAHRYDVGRHARRNRADLAAEIERFRCERRRRDERLHRILAADLDAVQQSFGIVAVSARGRIAAIDDLQAW